MSDLKKTDLHKLDLVQLKEILQRENDLLRNKKLIEKLPDKGQSIKAFRDKVEKEIKYRQEIPNIGTTMDELSLNESEKHIQRLCQIEKTPEKERYKPFATLNMVQEVPPSSKIFQIMEDCSQCTKPTKLILLPESMNILKKQDERIKDEQIRARNSRLLEKLQEYEDTDEEDNNSDVSLDDCPLPV